MIAQVLELSLECDDKQLDDEKDEHVAKYEAYFALAYEEELACQLYGVVA